MTTGATIAKIVAPTGRRTERIDGPNGKPARQLLLSRPSSSSQFGVSLLLGGAPNLNKAFNKLTLKDQRFEGREEQMIKLITFAAFALTVATSAQAMSPAPLHPLDGITTQVAVGCGAGRTRVNGVCVARTTKRQVRRETRRCAVWGIGNTCLQWY